MPRGGQRTPGPGKRLGRPPKTKNALMLAEMRELHDLTESDIAAFKHAIQTGFIGGVGKLAQEFAADIEAMHRRAFSTDPKTGERIVADMDAAKFILQQYLRFFQPDALVQRGSDRKVDQFIDELRDALAQHRPDTNDGRSTGRDGPTVVVDGGSETAEST